MEPLLLVANPAASRFTGGLHRAVVQTLTARFAVETAWPTSPSEAREVTRGAVAEGQRLVVAMGGDGIVHHVAQFVVGTEAVLGIIPAGTTNVLARLLGLPARPLGAARMLAGAHHVSLQPVIALSGTLEGGDELRRVATFAVGLGHDAEIVARAEAEPYRKYRFAGVHYARTALSALRRELSLLPAEMDVAAGDRRLQAAGVMAQIHEAYTFFGRVPLRIGGRPRAPLAVLVLRSLDLRQVTGILRRAATGGDLGEVRGLTVWTGVPRFTVQSLGAPVRLQADGELVGRIRRAEMALRPAALAVAVPA